MSRRYRAAWQRKRGHSLSRIWRPLQALAVSIGLVLLPGGGSVSAQAPGTAPHLTVDVVGNLVTLVWTAPLGGVPQSGWLLQAGSSPGLSNLAQVPIAAATTTLSVTAPPGVYYVRVRPVLVDASGSPSNEVIVSVGGCAQAPPVPSGVTADATGNNVRISWSPVTAGMAVSAYIVEVGSASGQADVAVLRVDARDTQVGGAAPTGTYFIRVRTDSACGISEPSREAVVTVGAQGSWSVARVGSELRVGYGADGEFPQYATLHTDSGYFRMNAGPGHSWGTSVVLTPSFWSRGRYYQGAPLTATWRTAGADLVIRVSATMQWLAVSGEVRVFPPAAGAISADVRMSVEGDVPLDSRPGEAFKPLMLSSMRIGPTLFDARLASVASAEFALPLSGYVVDPPARGTVFGLVGGISTWQTAGPSPTVEIRMDAPLAITGWVTPSTDPNDDNVGLWAAADSVLRSWQYMVTYR